MTIIIISVFGFVSYFAWVGAFALPGIFTTSENLQTLIPMAIAFTGCVYFASRSLSKREAFSNGFLWLSISFVAVALGGALSFFTQNPMMNVDEKVSSMVFVSIILPVFVAWMLRFFSKKIAI